MILNGKAKYAGQETRLSKASGENYTIVRLIDTTGQLFELMSKVPVPTSIPQFTDVEFETNITQGKFPKFTLISII